jgi:hypothetical protein
MRDRDVAASWERGQQPGDQPRGVILISDEMQDGQEQQRHRLAEVDHLAQRGVGQDLLRFGQVLSDNRGAGHVFRR